jgi:hypothetical protein
MSKENGNDEVLNEKSVKQQFEEMDEEEKKEFEFIVVDEMLPICIDSFASIVYKNNVDHGFWEGGKSLYNKSEKLMLMVTELAEACEALRYGNPPDDKLPEYAGDGVELADCIIRILDYCCAYGIPIGEILKAKHEYNVNRPYKHGKQF